jgi:hypothetical protein
MCRPRLGKCRSLFPLRALQNPLLVGMQVGLLHPAVCICSQHISYSSGLQHPLYWRYNENPAPPGHDCMIALERLPLVRGKVSSALTAAPPALCPNMASFPYCHRNLQYGSIPSLALLPGLITSNCHAIWNGLLRGSRGWKGDHCPLPTRRRLSMPCHRHQTWCLS